MSNDIHDELHIQQIPEYHFESSFIRNYLSFCAIIEIVAHSILFLIYKDWTHVIDVFVSYIGMDYIYIYLFYNIFKIGFHIYFMIYNDLFLYFRIIFFLSACRVFYIEHFI